MIKRKTLTQSLQRGNLSKAAIAFVSGSPDSSAETNRQMSVENSAENSSDIQALLAPTAAILAQGTVSMTFRLPADLSARLLRVSLDRKLNRQQPFTQQDIVAEALADWIKKLGDSL